MTTEFEWHRVLIAVVLLGCMFTLPMIVILRDLRRDLRRSGPDALSRPVRYMPDGTSYREGLPLPPPAVPDAARRARPVDERGVPEEEVAAAPSRT